jgi:hypothetical protein
MGYFAYWPIKVDVGFKPTQCNFHSSYPRSELLQEAQIVALEQPYIVDTVLQHCDTLGPHPKCEAGVYFWIVANRFQNVGMDHPSAKDLDPTSMLAEPAT